MTEGFSSEVFHPSITIYGVSDDQPPFRLVEIGGELVGKAFSVLDVLEYAYSYGLKQIDLNDPAMVRWVGGGQYTWRPVHWG
jgi:hypothetical protein